MLRRQRDTSVSVRVLLGLGVILLSFSVYAGLALAQTDADARKLAGQQLLREGLELFNKGTPESMLAAAEKNKEAISIFRSIGYLPGEAAALTNLGQMSYVLGNKKEALDYYEKSLEVGQASKDPEALGYAFSYLGRYYVSESDLAKGVEYLKKGVPLIIASNNNASDDADLIFIIHKSAGEEVRALDYFTQILSVARGAKNEKTEGNVLKFIGMLYWYLRDKPNALSHYLQALPLLRKHNDRRSIGATLNNIGVVYFSLGEFDRARLYYEEDLEISRADRNYAEQVVALINLGDLDVLAGLSVKARQRFQEALQISRAVKDKTGESEAMNHACTTFNLPEEREEALACHLDSLNRARALKDSDSIIAQLVNAAVLSDALQRRTEAFNYFTEALELSLKVGDYDRAVRVRQNLGRFELDRGNLEQARSHLDSAVQDIEATRAKLAGTDFRGLYLGIRSYVYKTYIDVLMELHKRQPSAGYDVAALSISERGRARSLVETLSEAGANIREGVAPELAERERSLQAQINSKARQRTQMLSAPHTEAEAKKIALEIEVLTADLQNAKAQIRQTDSRYASLTQPTIPTLPQIQALLDPDTILLEYSLGDSSSYLWAISSTSLASYKLPGAAQIKKAALNSYQRMAAQGTAPTGTASADLSLSQILLGPVAQQLGKRRIVIVADGVLQYLPFGALPDPALSSSAATYLPLIVNHEIVYLPSIAALAAIRTETGSRKPALKELAIIADPVFSEADERVKKSVPPASAKSSPQSSAQAIVLRDLMRKGARESGAERDGDNLARLPGSRAEAERIGQFLAPGDVHQSLGFNASRELVKSGVLNDYRKLLFSTHTLIDNVHPELTAIVLTLVDERGAPVDGYLRAHEIYNLRLSADLVVLSSCASGLGKDIEGEGLVGLTRGFMYAGARRLVVSLWKVDDEATAELMVHFFHGMLKKGLRPPEALRTAQITMSRSKGWSAPHYWAAFVLQGDWK